MAGLSDPSTIERTFLEVASFLRVSAAREEGARVSIAEATLLKLDGYIHFLQSLKDMLRGT